MGPSYDLQCFLGKYYIVYRDDSTDWNDKAYELSEDQYNKLDAFHDRQHGDLMDMYCDILNN